MEKNIRQIAQELRFKFRDRFLGRIRLRSGLPQVSATESLVREQEFYELLLNHAYSKEELRAFNAVIDVGSRNGSYFPALARACPFALIRGIEVDGGRRYWTGYRRADHAEASAQALQAMGRDVQYFWKDIRETSAETLTIPIQARVLVTLFYPFVSANPCVKWGLPPRYADYPSLIEHLRQMLGAIPEAKVCVLSIHQGEWEAEKARSIYESIGLEFTEREVERSEFTHLWPADHPAFAFRLALH